MMIVEHKIDYPITILNKERYNYYLDCERKALCADAEIREEALRMFREWTEKSDFKVEISMMPLLKTFKHSSKTSFYVEWYRDRCYGVKEMECPSFTFEKSLNDAVNDFVSEAYKEHRNELESEFDARVSKRAKSYQRMRKVVLCQWAVIIILSLVIALLRIL
jgi:hypothetical protein